jgi:hypothetical protein
MIAALRRGLNGRRGVALVLSVALLARIVRWAVDFPIWGDEAFVGCSLLARDLAGLLRPLEFEMVVPLGWLLPASWLARASDGATLALRLPALLAGVAALLLFTRLARRLLPRATALLAVAWFGASYYLIRHGAEVKPYAFDLLAGVALYGAALKVARAGPEHRVREAASRARGSATRDEPPQLATRSWAAFAAIGAIAVWCSYPAVFVAAGSGAAAWLLGPVAARRAGSDGRDAAAKGRTEADRDGASPLRRPAMVGAAALLLVATSFAAMYLRFGHAQQWSEERIGDARHWDDHFLPLARPWEWPWWLLCELTGNLLAYPNGGPRFGSSATFLLGVAGAVRWWRHGRRGELIVLLAPLVPMLAASALRKYPFGGSARIALHLAIPVCLLAATGVGAITATLATRFRRAGRSDGAIRERGRAIGRACRSAVVVSTAFLLLFAVGSPVRDLAKPWKTEQDRRSREAFEWFSEQVAPGDVVSVFGHFGDSGPTDVRSIAGAIEAPDLRHWRGSSGRLRFHLLRLERTRGVALRFGSLGVASPGAAAANERDRVGGPPPPVRVWSVVYRDNEAPFPEAALADWLLPFAARRATGEHPDDAPLARAFDLGPASSDPATGAIRRESIAFARH